MPPPVDLAGRSFGRLTVLELCQGPPRRWRCRCACGIEVELSAKQLDHRRTCGECRAHPCRICGKPAGHREGFCHTHGERWRRWGKPDPAEWAAAFLEERLSTCAVCGRQWNGYFGCRHCSPECLKASKRQYSLARFYAKTPEEKRQDTERSLARSREKRAERIEEKLCAICGETFAGFPHEVLCGKPACKSKNQTRGTRAYRSRRAVTEAAALATELKERLERAEGD